MRSIRFRAWDNHEKKIIYFPLSDVGNFVGYEVMQYTGLKDKNGKEIYEGDIIDDQGNALRYAVSWDDAGAGWKYIREAYMANCEVIGNVHQNPELIHD